MRLKSLEITNMRLVGEQSLKIEFAPNKHIALVVGDNGAGKTTILDALSHMLSPFISQFPGVSLDVIPEQDIHITEEGEWASALTMAAKFYMHDDWSYSGESVDLFENGDRGVIKVVRSRKGRGVMKSLESDLKEIRTYANSMLEGISVGSNDIKLPVLAYYGTDRGNIKGPERRTYSSKNYERWDCYSDALVPATNFKRFFAWFDLMEDEERREREKRQDFKFKSPILSTVREALDMLLEGKYRNPRIETRPLRFVMTERCRYGGERELRIEQMSAGFKIMVAMIADLAARMAEANPQSEHPLNESGIVLIDEIDLHLHAKWQRIVLKQLHEIFPSVQFVITTHSPLVVLGADSDYVQLFKLKSVAGVEEIALTEMSNYDVGLILLSDAFDVDSIYSPVIAKSQKRRMELLRKLTLTQEEAEELKCLDKQILSLPDSTLSPLLEELRRVVAPANN